MISVGQLDEAVIRAGFSSGGWTLDRGNLLLARGPKVHSLYPLYVTLREGDLFLVDISVSSRPLGTAVHIINMSPSRPLGLQIPQEIWIGSKPNYDKLRIFGCEAYALILKDDRRKLEPRSRKCVVLGYGPYSEIGYRL